jgi:hypothetical protein
MMDGKSLRLGCFVVLCLVPFLRHALAIRFVMDREECFSHNVDYEGDTVHVSFVVIKSETPWHYSAEGVDLVVWSSFFFPFFFICALLLHVQTTPISCTMVKLVFALLARNNNWIMFFVYLTICLPSYFLNVTLRS